MNGNVIDAYMKQKHRLIWQRRHPEVDLVGLKEREEILRRIEATQKKIKDNLV